ncbi:MAG TPA: DUF4184 family protein [Dongiaceae bacterium]|nr:DUF4184 family protein [Dongiaceae bacterium]
MPFTLAHPAAVLPLRRFCPRFLSFPALVAGSLCPDAGYAFAWLGADELAHRFVGSFVLCLPVGLVLLGLFVRGRAWFVRLAPGPWQAVFRPLWLAPLGSPGVVVCSLLVGTWTHLLWDSFTNQRGQATVFFSGLQVAVASVAGHQVRVCHVLWYACSFAGVACVLLAYERWLMRVSTGRFSWRPGRRQVARLLLLAALVLPIGAVHHLAQGWFGYFVVAGLSVGWGAGVASSLSRVLATENGAGKTPAARPLTFGTAGK